MPENSKILKFENLIFFQYFCGISNENINYLEDFFHVDIRLGDKEITIFGKNEFVTLCHQFLLFFTKKYINMELDKDLNLFNELRTNIAFFFSEEENEKDLDLSKFKHMLEKQKTNFSEKFIQIGTKKIFLKNDNQIELLEKFEKNKIVFVSGPAGTGKTFLSAAYACDLLQKNVIKKIILCRPAVEAGEKIGFLPGDIKDKIDPYLLPLYDIFTQIIGKDQFEKKLEKSIIEITALAFLRGRTLSDAVVILDEAQNTTIEQMKMFLTRIGFGSKLIINGDIFQSDIKNENGLVNAKKILREIDKIGFFDFSNKDIIRNNIISHILTAYQKSNNLN